MVIIPEYYNAWLYFKVLCVDQGNPKQEHRIGEEWFESSPEDEYLEVLAHQLGPSVCTCSTENQLQPGLHPEQCDEQVEGGDSFSPSTLPL